MLRAASARGETSLRIVLPASGDLPRRVQFRLPPRSHRRVLEELWAVAPVDRLDYPPTSFALSPWVVFIRRYHYAVTSSRLVGIAPSWRITRPFRCALVHETSRHPR